MATIDIKRAHQLPRDEARSAAENVAKRLEQKLEATWRWVGEDIVFEATGAKGKMTLTPGQVRVEIDLSFLLRPLKGKVEQKTNQYLDEYIK